MPSTHQRRPLRSLQHRMFSGCSPLEHPIATCTPKEFSPAQGLLRGWPMSDHRSMIRNTSALLSVLVFLLAFFPLFLFAASAVTFPSGDLTLHGVLYKPEGAGPFPAVLYNHGSAPAMLSKEAFETLGPLFARHGWVFFGPYRRGQGLSASAGPYIGDEIAAAIKTGGIPAGAATMVRLLETDHLNDQLAALAWLRTQCFVKPDHIAVAGNSFGGIEAVLGAERAPYCAAIDSAGGAQSWAQAPELQSLMTRSVRNSRGQSFSFRLRTITTCLRAGFFRMP